MTLPNDQLEKIKQEIREQVEQFLNLPEIESLASITEYQGSIVLERGSLTIKINEGVEVGYGFIRNVF